MWDIKVVVCRKGEQLRGVVVAGQRWVTGCICGHPTLHTLRRREPRRNIDLLYVQEENDSETGSSLYNGTTPSNP